MLRFIIRRLLTLIPVLFLVSILVFVLIRLMPGGAAMAYLRSANIAPTDEAIAIANRELGLDQPVLIQYFKWLRDAIHLDLGMSYYGNKLVADELAEAFGYTVWLTAAAFVWLAVISVPLGILSARKPGGVIDHISRVIAFIGTSMPQFLLGFLLVLLFSMKLGLLPVFGAKKAVSVILPSFTLSLSFIASYSRVLRNSILENMGKRYVLSGRARGLRERKIVLSHVLRNSLIPVISTLGVTFGHMLAGSVIVENVFAWPGMGRLLIDSVQNRDFPVLQGYVLLMAVIFVAANLLSDVLCALINPQIRYEEAR